MNPQDLEPLRKLLHSPEGELLRTYLKAEALASASIDNVRDMEHPYAQAVELQAEKKAHKKLLRILERIGFAMNDPKPSKDPRDSYAQ
jgi:hypothetical protein